MESAIDSIIAEFEQGAISRRELVQRLAGLTAAVAMSTKAGAQEASAEKAPIFQVRALNHLALRSPDIARARDWYRDTLGMSVTRDGESSCFLSFEQGFLAIFKGDVAGLDHFCFSIPDYDPDAVMETLEKGGFNPERHDDRIYFDDPDGLQVQLSAMGHTA